MTPQPESLWRATFHTPAFPALTRDLELDVAIVGGGITGLSAAVLLSGRGLRVAVLERDRIGSGESGSTTSHLTEAVDARYQTVIKDFGIEGARLVSESKRAAISRIETLAASVEDAGFERAPGCAPGLRRCMEQRRAVVGLPVPQLAILG